MLAQERGEQFGDARRRHEGESIVAGGGGKRLWRSVTRPGVRLPDIVAPDRRESCRCWGAGPALNFANP